ncbi:MAG: rod shape-determining protein MreC [Rickettsiales bacterium]
MKTRIPNLRGLNVKYHRASSLSLSVSLKPLLSFLSVCAFFVAALILMSMHQGGNGTAERLRLAISDTMAPVLSAIAKPSAAIDSSIAWVKNIGTVYSENKRLKAENAQLMQWQTVAEHLQTENIELKNLLDIRKESPASFVAARVISVPDYSFSHTFMINAGLDQNILEHQAVMSAEGMIGRILDVAQTSSHVLLLTDLNARIPVIASRTGEKAILAGNNSETPELLYVSAGTRFKVGDRLMTASDGGVVPAGLPVGEIISKDKDGFKVRLFAEPTQTDFIKVVAR